MKKQRLIQVMLILALAVLLAAGCGTAVKQSHFSLNGANFHAVDVKSKAPMGISQSGQYLFEENGPGQGAKLIHAETHGGQGWGVVYGATAIEGGFSLGAAALLPDFNVSTTVGGQQVGDINGGNQTQNNQSNIDNKLINKNKIKNNNTATGGAGGGNSYKINYHPHYH